MEPHRATNVQIGDTMWQRFSQTARRAILRAEYEALRNQSLQVETEHLLLSLATDTQDAGALILAGAGVTHRKVWSALASRGEEEEPPEEGSPKLWLNLDFEVEKLSEEFRVDSALIRRIENQMLFKLRGQSQKPELKLSPQLKRVLELASDEARRTQEASRQPHHIGTEHLLLGLLHDTGGRAAEVLKALGLNLEEARTMAAQFWRGRGEEPKAA